MDTQNEFPLIRKVDVFMRHHVLPFFNPEMIRWWFSLSGGKDSFAMAYAMRDWYQKNNRQLDANGFHISQWSGSCSQVIQKQLGWLKFYNIDARTLTQERIRYKLGDQAPCRNCADIRRELNDKLIKDCSVNDGKVNFLARGLHLTDTTISLLWRRSLGYDSAYDFVSNGKGNPLSKLWDNTFLAKPLYYAREFETQDFAKKTNIKTTCCGCPACKFPSRRDIVEETIAPLFNGDLWEFSTPDLTSLFKLINNGPTHDEIMSISAPGKEDKRPHLPSDFAEFALKFYRKKLKQHDVSWLDTVLDKTTDLDALGMKWLQGHTYSYETDRIPTPALLCKNKYIDIHQASLISSLGPFWGAAALPKADREKASLLQKKLFGLSFDENWTHSHELVKEYYLGEKYDTSIRKNNGFHSISCTNNCFCSA